MLRIVALNEDSVNHEEEHVSKEAEETIAISEYMRALVLKQEKKSDIALSLFLELLETQVINDVNPANVESKLITVKYNCHRNIAFIYEDQGNNELALKHLIKAIEIDEADVYTICKLGQLALVADEAEIAKRAFEKCLVKNPNHWPSLDGMLQALCLSESVSEAYGVALYCHKKDSHYERAIDVLTEISQRFASVLPFLENLWKGSFTMDITKVDAAPIKKTCFPVRVFPVQSDYLDVPVIDFSHFCIETLDWLTTGSTILKLYDFLMDNNYNLCHPFCLEDFVNTTVELKQEEEANVDAEEIVLEDDSLADASKASIQTEAARFLNKQLDEQIVIVDSESDTAKDQSTESKPKNRRRCSDLTFLEQWGWHKNRRSARKKSKEEAVEDIDTTVNGFLRKVMPRYFIDMFEFHKAPFSETIDDSSDSSDSETTPETEVKKISLDEFQQLSSLNFQNFKDDLKGKDFDLIFIIYKWLKHICPHANVYIPVELRAIYIKLFKLHARHNYLENLLQLQLSDDEFSLNYCMILFDLELELDVLETACKDSSNKMEIPVKFHRKIDLMKFYTGFMMSDPNYDSLMVRMLWLMYCIHKYENELDFALNFLYKVEVHLKEFTSVKSVRRINTDNNKYFDAATVRKLITCFERNIRINNLKSLYDNQDYPKLIEILSESLINVDVVSDSSISHITVQTQIEILLEALWATEHVEECLAWCEKSLFYSVSKCLSYPNDSGKYKEWAANVNFILTYIEALIKEHSGDILNALDQIYSARLVQTLCKIVSNQLDLDPTIKATPPKHHCIETAVPWIILHHILQKEDDRSSVARKALKENELSSEEVEFSLPNAVLLLFTAHDSLGRRLWCTKDNGRLLLYILNVIVPPLRSPLLEPCRDIVNEYLEQITYCLYGFPTKKARQRHIEEHEAKNIDLTWDRGIQLFNIYRPDHLPEFDSYKFNSMSAEMEGLCQRIITLMPETLDLTASSVSIKNFINGIDNEINSELLISFPSNINSIYYLLADYYFKSRDFIKAIKYYILDLTMHPSRFDSWANLALSKASKVETKLNSCLTLNVKHVLDESDQVFRCFEQCLKLNANHTLLRIEFGSFAYIVNSFCSRNLKSASDTLSMEMFEIVEKKKDQCFEIAHQCFSAAAQSDINLEDGSNDNSDEENQDEKWLFYYMLGKISEKRKEIPENWLDMYSKSAKTLYESNATYPIKVNHSSPANLSIEALEIYYRISSGIIKYLEQHTTVSKKLVKYFNKILKELSTSPFAINRAKVNDNALKRKINTTATEVVSPPEEKKAKLDDSAVLSQNTEQYPEITINVKTPEKMDCGETIPDPDPKLKADPKETDKPQDVLASQTRRESQESAATNPTTAGNSSNSSSSSSSSSSDSSSSDSETDTSSDEEDGKDKIASQEDIDAILKMCIKNLEECVTRFPEHYKSVYRLVYHFMNAVGETKSVEKSKQLLTGTYKTALGNFVQGLFSERKNNNFFNGIWRIPSSEIDRPGNFTSHLTKCVIILMEVLKQTSDYSVLFDLALNLHRIPDNDKKYLKDCERKELFNQAVTLCIQALRNLLKKYTEEKNEEAIIELLKEIFKNYRKCSKYMQAKETAFSSVLVDTYKAYVELRKVKLPDNANHLDLAVKLCQQELNAKKNQPVVTATPDANVAGVEPAKVVAVNSVPVKVAAINIPGLPKVTTPKSRPVMSNKNFANNTSHTTTSSMLSSVPNPFASASTMSSLLSMYNNPGLMTPLSQMSDAALHVMLAEYYKMGLNAQKNNAMFNQPMPNMAALFGASSLPALQGASMSSANSSTSNALLKGIPDISIIPTHNKAKKTSSSKGASTSNTNKNMSKNPYSIPTDLPKSLSITPSQMSGDPPPAHKVTMDKVKKDVLKMHREKMTKKFAAHKTHPYAQPQQQKLYENLAKMGSSLSITPQMNVVTPKYPAAVSNSSAKTFLDEYQRQITSQVLDMLPKNRKQKSSGKRSLPSIDLSHNLASAYSIPSDTTLSIGKSSLPSSPMPSFAQNLGRPTSVPHLSSAAHMSPYSMHGAGMRQSLTPPTSSPHSTQSSPTKTLQQKLAERQQKNHQKSSTPPVNTLSKNKDKMSNDDVVIILDE